MVSLQNGEEIIIILLLYALATIIDNFEFSFILLQLTLLQIVEDLRSEARCWRLKRKWHAVRKRLMWSLRIVLFWLYDTALTQVVIIYNEHCWSLICAQAIQLFKVLPNYPQLFDSTLGYPGEGWKAGRQRKRNGISTTGPRNLKI